MRSQNNIASASTTCIGWLINRGYLPLGSLGKACRHLSGIIDLIYRWQGLTERPDAAL